MQGKKILIAVLAFSVLLSMTGCGSTGRFVRALGKALEKTIVNKNDEDAEEDTELSLLAEDDTEQNNKENNSALTEDDAKNEKEQDAELLEKTLKESSATPAPPREGVTGFDDIFSGEKQQSDQEDYEYDSFDMEDEELSYDEFVARNLDKCKSDLEADKGSVQSDVDSDTVQWLNATYALITESNSGDRTLVGGMERNTINAVFMRYQLYSGWGIEDSESADETLEWLRSEGHRQKYMELVEVFEETGLFSLSQEEFDQTIKENFGEFGNYTVNYLKTIYDCHETCGDKGILAWDLCRINQVASWCYLAGYYTLDEALEIQYQNSLLIQESFSSWDDMMESYLYGFRYWKGDSRDSLMSDTAKRRNIYDSLKAISGGPYSCDFKMQLQRSWKTAE